MKGTVIIDCFPESAERYREGFAVVVIDVIRATTTATTAVAQGRRVIPAQTTDEAFVRASTLADPLLVGELGGNMCFGFDLTNSPAQISVRKDVHRPMVLVSSSGTQLLLNAKESEAVYIACFRNLSAMAGHLAGRYERVAILGAGTRGQFRREDQMGCAWIAEKLIRTGYEPASRDTEDCIARWKGVSPEEVRGGRSAEYLRKSGQTEDLDFILRHVDDLDTVPQFTGGELVPAAKIAARSSITPSSETVLSRLN
jgi:2-phosphosulfolactate phosphatase